MGLPESKLDREVEYDNLPDQTVGEQGGGTIRRQQTVGEAYAEAAAIADEYIARQRRFTVHQHGTVVLVDFPSWSGQIGHLAVLTFPFEAMADAFVSSLR